jgi:ABC-type antimicrobial peptide transport system permease subunit
MTVGAQRKQVLRLVLRQGLGVIVGGGTLGIVASAVTTRLLTKLLYGVKPADPLMLASVIVRFSESSCWQSIFRPAWVRTDRFAASCEKIQNAAY